MEGKTCGKLALDLSEQRFPYLFRGKEKRITGIEVFVAVDAQAAKTHNTHTLDLNLVRSPRTEPECASPDGASLKGTEWQGLLKYAPAPGNEISGDLGRWTITAQHDGKPLDPKALSDILLLCRYNVT